MSGCNDCEARKIMSLFPQFLLAVIGACGVWPTRLPIRWLTRAPTLLHGSASDAGSHALMVSCDADVAWASQLQHTVQDVDSNCHFGRLTLVGLRAQCMTDDPFPAANIGFHQGTPVVPRRFLPTHAAVFGNRLQMPVTRSGRILGRLARHAT